uniref:SFRICE_021140 n=1 Tax=Spodoptera frugiperda TaxID=7108 RepID=A0A2H1WNE7_SPOFR
MTISRCGSVMLRQKWVAWTRVVADKQTDRLPDGKQSTALMDNRSRDGKKSPPPVDTPNTKGVTKALAGLLEGHSFIWIDGFFSVAVGQPGSDGCRPVYFHPMGSNQEFFVPSCELETDPELRTT